MNIPIILTYSPTFLFYSLDFIFTCEVDVFFLKTPNDGLLCLIDFGFQPEGIIYSTYPYNGLVTPIGLTTLLYSLSGDYCRLPLTPEHSHNTSVTLSV